MTFNGTTIRVYRNGGQIATRAASGAIATTTDPLWIGGNLPYGEFFNGAIDEVRVYNVALTAAQIQSDMARPVGSTSSDTQAPTAPGTPTASTPSSTQVDLAWSAATDNVGVTGYHVERCTGAGCTDVRRGGHAHHDIVLDTGRAASTTYIYRVRANDLVGNLGPYSGTVTATTPAGE
ncbi:MAG: LamG-like jellyroll fold domain-containing protein [Dehalococcoidia bacterium]